MSNVVLCVLYVFCFLNLYNGVIIPLLHRVEKLENELDSIKDSIYISK